MEWKFETVYTVLDFYDRPRFGLADFDGRPHLYECPFSETRDDYLDHYRLQPVDRETLDLDLERWAIWRAWQAAFYAGHVSHTTGPALPQNQARYAELTRLLEPRLAFTAEPPIWATAEFRVKEPRLDDSGARDFEVRWTVLSAAELDAVTDDRKGSS